MFLVGDFHCHTQASFSCIFTVAPEVKDDDAVLQDRIAQVGAAYRKYRSSVGEAADGARYGSESTCVSSIRHDTHTVIDTDTRRYLSSTSIRTLQK